MKIGFLGLGIMGSRMAANLIRGGHDLVVWNRTASRADPLVEMGAAMAGTCSEAVLEAEVVITMLSEPGVVESTALGSGGFLDAMQKGSLWMDSSTVNPSFSRKMADEAQQRGLRFIDAPVAGTKGPAEKRQLLFLVGGHTADLEQARPLMGLMGREVIHAGEIGMGTSLKMVFNMLLASAMLSFSEGLALGEVLGFQRERMLDLLLGGAVVAPFVSGKRARIELSDYEADFPLQWMQKDLQLATQTAYEQGLAVPTANIAKEIYLLAARAGLGEQDFSAIYKFIKQGANNV